MASRGWGKNKKGVLVNSAGKTALEVRLDKYAAKLKARKEKLAAKKAEAKAKASSGGSGGGGGREQELEKLKNDRRSEQNLANEKYNAGLAKETADWMATRRPGKKRPKISKAFKEWEKTTDAIEEKYNKLTAAIEEKYRSAKPASKGSEEVKTEWGGSIAELKQKDRNPLNQLIDTKAVAPKNPVSRYNKQEIEDLAQKLAKGETSQLNPVLVRKVGFEKYEVVRGDKEFYAAQRARELNPGLESVETFSVKPNEIKAAKRQLSLFKGEKNQVSAVVRDRFQIDLADIDSSVKGNQVPLSAQAKSLLEVGANLVPVVLRKKKGGRFEVVSGHQVYHAAMAAKKRDRTFEVVNAVIID